MDNNIQKDEQVIIAGLDTGQEDYDYSMTELAELAQANHMDVVQRVDQVIDRPNPATYFGTGKVAEIAEVAATNDATTIITNTTPPTTNTNPFVLPSPGGPEGTG